MSSPIFEGLARPDPPTDWDHTNLLVGVARQNGFFPPQNGGTVNDFYGYELTWHHNIPWKTLRDSWTVVFVFCEWDVVESMLRLYGGLNDPLMMTNLKKMREAIGPTEATASSSTYERWVERYTTGRGGSLSHLANDKQITNVQGTNLAEWVAWQGWNIVEGPKESVRTEDPGSDGFDDFIEADPKRFNRYQKVQQLYNVLVEIEKDYQAKKASPADYQKVMCNSWSTKLRSIARGAQFLIKLDKVIFDFKMWRVVRQGGAILTKDLTGKIYYQVRRRKNIDL